MGRIIGITASSILKTQSGVIVSDADAQLFVDNVGITLQLQGDAINNLVISLKADLIWNKLIVINPKVGGTAARHKFNLKNPLDTNAGYRYTYGGTWIHSGDGAKPNGINAYANTYFNPVALGLSSNLSFGFYLTISNSLFGDKHSFGSYSSGTNWIGLQHNTSTQLLGAGYDASANSPLTITSPNNGFFAMSINGTVKKTYHKNSVGTFTVGGSAPANINFYEGALNVNNSYYNGINGTYGCSFIGQGLTDTEMANLQTAIITFETALGRNV